MFNLLQLIFIVFHECIHVHTCTVNSLHVNKVTLKGKLKGHRQGIAPLGQSSPGIVIDFLQSLTVILAAFLFLSFSTASSSVFLFLLCHHVWSMHVVLWNKHLYIPLYLYNYQTVVNTPYTFVLSEWRKTWNKTYLRKREFPKHCQTSISQSISTQKSLLE